MAVATWLLLLGTVPSMVLASGKDLMEFKVLEIDIPQTAFFELTNTTFREPMSELFKCGMVRFFLQMIHLTIYSTNAQWMAERLILLLSKRHNRPAIVLMIVINGNCLGQGKK